MFNFFLQSYRSGILTFSGTHNPKVEFDINGDDCKETFKKYDNGLYKDKVIKTCHPNIVNGLIKSKKSWGLWVQEWSKGIGECNFRKEEIIEEFTKCNIIIPDSFNKEFDNFIQKEKIKFYESWKE